MTKLWLILLKEFIAFSNGQNILQPAAISDDGRYNSLTALASLKMHTSSPKFKNLKTAHYLTF